jgi:fibro-slime domain-containing protein
MCKKMFFVSAFAFVAFAPGLFAQNTAELDVKYRDFPVDAPGFEQFLGCDSDGNSESSRICHNNRDYATGGSSSCPSGYEPLKYGDIGGGKEGYTNGPDKDGNRGNWDGNIKVTLGMVQEELFYDKDNCDYVVKDMEQPDNPRDWIKYRYCARPQQGNGNCGSAGNLEKWFSDGGEARLFDSFITLDRQSDGRTFLIEYNGQTTTRWNSDGSDKGFFSLVTVEGLWGRQSLNHWCPKEDGEWGESRDVCREWWNNGGPRDREAGIKTANSRSIKNKLHNYGFSMSGSATFKYIEGANDIFEFIGDDDMWIFIDGRLTADLGGVHMAAPAKLKIEDLAKDRGWKSGSTHALHFFYMDRNTDGSNFKIKMALSGLSDSKFNAPIIKKSETTADDNGTSTQLYVSSELDLKDVQERFVDKDKEGIYGIIVKSVEDGKICGYRLDDIKYSYNAKSDGQVYTISGKVICDGKEPRDLASGDSLSFNTTRSIAEGNGYNTGKFALPDNYPPIWNKSHNRSIDRISLAINNNKLKLEEFAPKIPDAGPDKPDFPSEQLFGDGAEGGGAVSYVPGGGGKAPGFSSVNSTNAGRDNGGKVNSFGAAGKIIPSNRTGELILTAFPSASDNDWKEVAEGDYFGLPPSANRENGLYGLADPSKKNMVEDRTTGGFPFVKNGFSKEGEGSANGSMQVSATRCVSTINKREEAKINCLNFNLIAMQPFHLAVTVYDQLGNFVTQYRETVTEQEFRYITQGPNYISGVKQPLPSLPSDPEKACEAPTQDNYGKKNTLTTNGRVNVNVNIYPFSQSGRKFGNGVYLVKIDRVDLPFEGCYSTGGASPKADMGGPYPFVRNHADIKFGWVRTK